MNIANIRSLAPRGARYHDLRGMHGSACASRFAVRRRSHQSRRPARLETLRVAPRTCEGGLMALTATQIIWDHCDRAIILLVRKSGDRGISDNVRRRSATIRHRNPAGISQVDHDAAG